VCAICEQVKHNRPVIRFGYSAPSVTRSVTHTSAIRMSFYDRVRGGECMIVVAL
jgi:hypothetical protein